MSKRIETYGDLMNAEDQTVMDRIKALSVSDDSPPTKIVYRELNRRYVKKAADRVVLAAVITAVATILIQVINF